MINSISAYTPTFMEKLLGKNYKWWYALVFYFRSTSTNITAFYISQFSYITEALIIVYLWFQSSQRSELFTYLIMGRLFRSIISSYYYTDLTNMINTGTISKKLLQPQDFFWSEAVSNLGQRLAKNPPTIIGSIIAAIISNFLFIQLTPPDFKFLFLVVLFIPIAFSIQYLFGYIFGCISFFIYDKRDVWAYQQSFDRFISIFAGYYIPLNSNIFPMWIQNLPFAFLLHHAMQIYLGNYNPQETLSVFAGGIAWCLVLYFLARFVFKIGLKRNEAVGL